MPEVEVCIPQIGEGLQEARLVAVLKQPGDRILRDEPIYQMETDKAVMDVESPFEGVLLGWLAAPDTVLPIGAPIAKLDVPSAAPIAADPPDRTSNVPARSGPTIISLRIPQIGEGLQEARLVGVLKQPGEMVRRDEPIYQMETDKAVMDVESPYAGQLTEWLVAIDSVLPIGAEVARMQVEGEVLLAPASHFQADVAIPASSAAPGRGAQAVRRTDIPPRTRAYAKERGLTDAQIAGLPSSGNKLMPSDIDTYLAGVEQRAPAPTAWRYAEHPMGSKQRLLSSRLVRGNQIVVPGTITVATRWSGIEAVSARYKADGGDFQPSKFTLVAYAVVRAMKAHPLFRSTIVGDSVVRTYEHAHLGIAVSLPGDELVLAVVDEADALAWPEFALRMREQIALARDGKDQAHEAVTLSLTNMQAYGLRDAVPVVAPPSVGTLFLGEVFRALDPNTEDLVAHRYVNLALTFDHRLINGVGGSEFINAVKSNVERIEEVLP